MTERYVDLFPPEGEKEEKPKAVSLGELKSQEEKEKQRRWNELFLPLSEKVYSCRGSLPRRR